MARDTSLLPPKYLLQEVALTQECKELISSLPKEKGYVFSYSYKYEGFWYTPIHLQGLITCQKYFQAQDSDVFLVTIPKSGTTWLKAIMFTLINRKNYPFADKLKPEETGSNSLEDFFDLFCKGVNTCGPFWDNVLDYWNESKKNSERILFLKYEELKEEPNLHLRRLAEFLGCPFSADEEETGMVEEILKLCSFNNLSNLEINKSTEKLAYGMENKTFFRRGEVGDWKDHLTTDMAKKIDQIIEQMFSGSGLLL
ncbi:Cytosolic sulfotransferase 4 [Forsythia ovata]|uniref:Sulfotransferase n=1 Tax=Forsythia ovata TaxID=205694 RepID=A0ABD1WCZ7_9LAMI